MAHSIKDPLLIKTKDAIDATLQTMPAPIQTAVQQTVVAGLKILYSANTHQSIVAPVYATLRERGFQPTDIANGVANLLNTIFKASQGKMHLQSATPAGIILLCYVLDDLEQLYQLKVTSALIAEIFKALALTLAKVSPASPGAPPSAAPPGVAGVAQQPVPAQGVA
jgi:hypothetical protein